MPDPAVPAFEPAAPTQRSLPGRPDVTAPDGSLVRLLATVPQASMAHFELRPGQVSIAQRHRTVTELWYVLGGHGRMWRRSSAGDESEIALCGGVSLSIPVGTTFQFRCDGDTAFTAVGVTIPAWPGEAEAVASTGCWEPAL